MPGTKVQDDAELVRWIAEGRTYAWMVERYRTQYNLLTVPSMFGNFRRRRGLERRTARDVDLIPWAVSFEHRWAYPVEMLRIEGRRRAGFEVSAGDRARVATWLETRRVQGDVVAYDPAEGFSYVPRRAGIDTGLIREPEVRTGRRAVG